ncbi:MAG TPA: RagB/SusD family nutrient uptake outer membrane protein [Chitinophagaceae bacterium]
MKKQFKYILGLTMVGMLATSCRRELLDPVPQTSITDATAFDTPDRILNQVRSIYAAMKNGNYYGGRYVVYGDIRADDFLNETSNNVTGYDVYNLNPTNSSQNTVKNLWSQAYFTINLANLFLDGMAEKGSTVVGQTVANNYIGEARFIRAVAYYSLLQYYARPYADGNGSKPGLPLRLTGIKGPGFSDLARSTVGEVYTQILADLDFAEANLPLTQGSALLNTTRAHRNTAIAFKTRVLLSMQRYADVISNANKIVSTGAPFVAATGVAHALQADITNVFKAPYTTTESILSMPMSTTSGDFPGTQNQLGFYWYMNGSTAGSSEYRLNPAGVWANANWPATDKRKSSLVYINGSNGKLFVSKWTTGSPYTDYVPVIRYSEVLLNLAEAIARTTTGVDTRALALVNAVRQRSDAAYTVTAATNAELINAIMLERRIEFLGEGLRNNDIMRLLATIPAKGTAPSKTPADVGYIWPISSDELSLNKLMTDN